MNLTEDLMKTCHFHPFVLVRKLYMLNSTSPSPFPFFFPVVVKMSDYLEYTQLEIFKKTLMQSLQEDDDGSVSTLNPHFVKLEHKNYPIHCLRF